MQAQLMEPLMEPDGRRDRRSSFREVVERSRYHPCIKCFGYCAIVSHVVALIYFAATVSRQSVDLVGTKIAAQGPAALIMGMSSHTSFDDLFEMATNATGIKENAMCLAYGTTPTPYTLLMAKVILMSLIMNLLHKSRRFRVQNELVTEYAHRVTEYRSADYPPQPEQQTTSLFTTSLLAVFYICFQVASAGFALYTSYIRFLRSSGSGQNSWESYQMFLFLISHNPGFASGLQLGVQALVHGYETGKDHDDWDDDGTATSCQFTGMWVICLPCLLASFFTHLLPMWAAYGWIMLGGYAFVIAYTFTIRSCCSLYGGAGLNKLPKWRRTVALMGYEVIITLFSVVCVQGAIAVGILLYSGKIGYMNALEYEYGMRSVKAFARCYEKLLKHEWHKNLATLASAVSLL